MKNAPLGKIRELALKLQQCQASYYTVDQRAKDKKLWMGLAIKLDKINAEPHSYILFQNQRFSFGNSLKRFGEPAAIKAYVKSMEPLARANAEVYVQLRIVVYQVAIGRSMAAILEDGESHLNPVVAYSLAKGKGLIDLAAKYKPLAQAFLKQHPAYSQCAILMPHALELQCEMSIASSPFVSPFIEDSGPLS